LRRDLVQDERDIGRPSANKHLTKECKRILDPVVDVTMIVLAEFTVG
jgi:hypothetical protein